MVSFGAFCGDQANQKIVSVSGQFLCGTLLKSLAVRILLKAFFDGVPQSFEKHSLE